MRGLLLMCLMALGLAAEPIVIGKVIRATGDVMILRDWGEGNVKPDKETPLYTGDRLVTYDDSWSYVRFRGESRVALAPKSSVEFTAIGEFNQISGLAYYVVSDKSRRPGRVTTPMGIIATTPGEFMVDVKSDEVMAVKGALTLSGKKGREVRIPPGTFVSFGLFGMTDGELEKRMKEDLTSFQRYAPGRTRFEPGEKDGQ